MHHRVLIKEISFLYVTVHVYVHVVLKAIAICTYDIVHVHVSGSAFTGIT